MEKIIDIQNVSKAFKHKSVLERVTLSILSNQVTAIVGKNGSGKSTLLKIIGGLTKPDSGQIFFRNEKPLQIGYVPEVIPSVIPFTPVKYLTYMGKIRGLQKEWLQQRINNLLNMFQMESDRNIKIVDFSKGMKQKVMIMQAMLEETDLLIMDEPLSGLDPKAQSELEELLVSLKEREITVILTCHETRLLEQVVDRLVVIDQGKTRQVNNLNEQNEFMNRIVLELPNTVSIVPLRNKVMIKKEKEVNSKLRLIELYVVQDQTNNIVKDLLNCGASIKYLAPLHKKETDFFKLF